MTDSIRDVLAEKYADLYEAEGYHMVASAPIYIPYWCVDVHCRFLKMQAMTSMELTVLQCIDRDIKNVPDIAFVMAMDMEIIQIVMESFVAAGVLENKEEGLDFTTAGREIFQSKKMERTDENEAVVFQNGVTGELALEEPDFFDGSIEDTSICLGIEEGFGNEEICQSRKLYQWMDEKYHVKLCNMKVLGKEIKYCEEYVLFYKNQSGNIKFQIYHMENQSFDLALARVLLEKYEKRRLYEIMKVESVIRLPEQRLDTYRNPVGSLKYYRNQELRELFKDVFRIAKKSVFIVAPWIDNNRYVMTEQLLGQMKQALDNQVQITIGYGYLSEEKNRQLMETYEATGKFDRREEKNVNTEIKARVLREYFKEYPGFSMRYLGTHEKILCYDERYIVIGSFNFLSYDGGEKVNYGGSRFRFEGGVLIDDAAFARHVIGDVFSMQSAGQLADRKM